MAGLIIDYGDENPIPIADEDTGLWDRIRNELHIGDSVTGTVICRRPFGVFVDIGYGSRAPALLLVPDFIDAHNCAITYDEYPHAGDSIAARVLLITEDHKIRLTQQSESIV